MARLAFIIGLFCVRLSWAQTGGVTESATPNFLEHFAQENGLSQGTGYAITQYDDFMWFATQDGLNRFDGYEFKVFRPSGRNGLNNSIVQTLLVDSKKRFWIGTGGGLNIYNKENQRFSRFAAVIGVAHAVDSVSIEKLLEDRQGNIWIMTDEKGLFCLNPVTRKIRSYFPDNNALTSLCLSSAGDLWVSDYQATYRYDSVSDTFRVFLTKKQLGTPSLLSTLLVDKQNNLWIGTRDDGIFMVPKASLRSKFIHFRQGNTNRDLSSNESTALLCDRLGRVWIGSRTGGISLFNPASGTFTYLKHSRNNARSLAENGIWSLFEDQRGIIWIGLNSHGVDKYDPNRFPFQLIQRDVDAPAVSVPDNMIFRLTGEGNMVYIGTGTGGLAQFSLASQQVVPLLSRTMLAAQDTNQIISNEVRVIVPDDKKLWLANGRGLILYNPVGRTHASYKAPDQYRQLYAYAAYPVRDSAGRTTEIWTGGGSGLARFDVLTKRWKNWDDLPTLKTIAQRTIRLMYADDCQNLWLGTLGHGLIRYNRVTHSVTTFDKANGLPCANIRSMLAVDKTLWIGTDCGLFSLDLETYKITHHYSSQSSAASFRFPNDVIYGILNDDQGYLWVSSNKGLSRFSPKLGIVKNFDRNDGLQSDEFNTNVCYRHPDGTLFFGGINGINFFRPDRLNRNTFIPPVRITRIAVLDSTYAPEQKQLTLRYDQNFVRFEFAALNFTNTEKNQYQYKLDGIDPDWVQAQYRRYADYTKLPPGDYVFQVKGSNDDGVWSNEVTTVNVSIRPPFWITWWFRVLLIGLLIGGMYGIYRYRIHEIKTRQADILSGSIRTQELERQRFAKELHDGVGANLAVLKMYLSSLGSLSVPIDEIRSRSLDVLKSSIEDIRSIIHDMHPRSLNEFGLVYTIREMVQLFTDGQRIHVTFDAVDVPQKLPSAIEINLFRVVQELLQNALKHSKADSVWLQMRVENNFLRVSYRDNGEGFSPELAKRLAGNGLVNINERIKLLGGSCTFTSEPHRGTIVAINVPLVS
ncbi:two-component regulator propeller domain-containing protein [Spirosoma daeguense]